MTWYKSSSQNSHTYIHLTRWTYKYIQIAILCCISEHWNTFIEQEIKEVHPLPCVPHLAKPSSESHSCSCYWNIELHKQQPAIEELLFFLSLFGAELCNVLELINTSLQRYGVHNNICIYTAAQNYSCYAFGQTHTFLKVRDSGMSVPLIFVSVLIYHSMPQQMDVTPNDTTCCWWKTNHCLNGRRKLLREKYSPKWNFTPTSTLSDLLTFSCNKPFPPHKLQHRSFIKGSLIPLFLSFVWKHNLFFTGDKKLNKERLRLGAWISRGIKFEILHSLS